MQTKKQSFLESLTNIIIGYVTALISQLLIFPLFDIIIPFTDNLLIGLYFTIVSLIRSYLVRRWYNKRNKIEFKLKEKD